MSKHKDKIYKAIRAVIFSFICLCGILIIGQGFIQMDDGKLAAIKCGQYYDLEKNSLDVLCVGASTLKGGFSPDTLYQENGIVSYQRGTSAMAPSLVYYSVKEALKTQHPALVIADAGQLYKHYDYTDEAVCMTLNANLDFCHLSLDKAEAAFKVSEIAESEKVPDILFPMLHYHNRWETVSYKDFSTAIQTPYDPLMGQSLYWKTVPQPTLVGHMDIPNSGDGRKYNKDGVESFTRMIEYCKSKGVDVLLVRAPRADWSWADSEGLQKYADKMGVEYLDMNTDEVLEEMGVTGESDFHNPHHLNYKGSEKMTRWLGNYIMEHYDIDTSDTTETTNAQREKNVQYYKDLIAEHEKAEQAED